MRTSRRAAALVSASLALSIACSSGGGSGSPPPAEPQIALSGTSLSFAAGVGSDPAAATVSVTNAGGGALATPALAVSYGKGAGWLETTVAGASPYTVGVQPRVSGLAAGSYDATITVACAGASNSPRALAVSLTVTAATPAIALSPPSLTFTTSLGGVAQAQSVAVSNAAGGTLAAPTAAIGYADGAGWLRATPSGSAPYAISVQPDATGLPAGTYRATVSVASAGASNSPQSFGVSLTVVDPAAALSAMELSPTALSFAATAGGANPGAQAVRVANLGGATLEPPTVSIAYGSGAGWLDATVSGAAAPYTIGVQARVGTLGAGTYRATIAVSSTGAANDPQSVPVTFIVEPAPTEPAIALSPASLSLAAVEGATSPVQRTVSVTNSGGGTLAAPTARVVTADGWLSAEVSGTAVTVSANAAALGPGSYFGTIEVASTGASNSPVTLPVALAVADACGRLAAPCTTGGECCSGTCGPNGCAMFCEGAGATCASDSDCCSMSCSGGTCAATACATAGSDCAAGSECCSGVCTGSRCVAPPGGACRTLGELCSAGVDCCSRTCQGGHCAPAYTCNAPGDVCARPEDCCSGLCSAAAGGSGRCLDASGGCGQDGVPCDNDSGCCTRLCVDLGTGTKVCQPAGGCRMTGDYCDSTASCCNINDSVPRSQWISCTADHTCDNGGSCNPPGNICGATTDVNASQNCCHEGGGSGKPVCKPDSNGIHRCFGGTVSQTCPTGWDGSDPRCCIQPGAICQFRDQCCDGAPCVPDSGGILRCSAGTTTCIARGDPCTGVSGSCCEGTTCEEGSGTCEPPFACLQDAAPCSTTGAGAEACCSGLCVPSAQGATTGTCATCVPNDGGCSVGSQCCSGACDPDARVCLAPCVAAAGACTVDGDCCAGLTCDVPAGATSGTCTETVTTCAATGQTCAADVDCCNMASGDTCFSGACAACLPVNSDCSGGRPCCGGTTCTSAESPLYPCQPGSLEPCYCTQAFMGN